MLTWMSISNSYENYWHRIFFYDFMFWILEYCEPSMPFLRFFFDIQFLLQHSFLCRRHRYGNSCYRSWWYWSPRILVRVSLCRISYLTSEVIDLQFHERCWSLKFSFNISSRLKRQKVSILEAHVSLHMDSNIGRHQIYWYYHVVYVHDINQRWKSDFLGWFSIVPPAICNYSRIDDSLSLACCFYYYAAPLFM